MTAISVSAPFPILTDIDGDPLEAGYVYIGQANLDPVAFPKSAYWDASLTTPAAQPIRTTGGYPVRNGSPARIYTGGDYSIRINNKNGTLVYSSPAATDRMDSALVGYDGGTVQGVLDAVTGPNGAASVGYTPAGTGAVPTTVQSNLRKRQKLITDFLGVDLTGSTESTSAFNLAKDWAASVGGATIILPNGIYMLKDFVLDQNRVIFEGLQSCYTYGLNDDSAIKIKAAPGSVFTARLKGTRSGVAINAAEGSGFRNVQFDDTAYNAQYNLFIDSGATVVEDVTLLGSNYNCVIADQANANVFKRVSMRKGRYVNFAVTEHQAASYMHPGITDLTSVSNTTIHMEDVNIRQGLGFGAVIRSLVGASGSNVVIESNNQAGLYIYRPDNATVRGIGFNHWWLENNYEGYTSGSTSYSIANNRMLWIGTNTPIAWTSAYQAGYQMIIDSQTHYGGGCDTLDFNLCQFNNEGLAQKSVLILSGFKINFFKPWLTGGDVANRIKVTSDAEAVHWHDPMTDNNPYALEPSLVAAHGANTGSRGAYFKSGTSFGVAELGGIHPVVGVFGGPIQFQAPVVGDPRRADVRTLDDYFENTNTVFAAVWRTGAATPFTINSQTNEVTKIGRLVTLNMKCTVTAVGTTAGNDRLYITGFPYPATASDFIVGQAFVRSLSAGPGVLNNGITPLYLISTDGLYSVLDMFPPITVGQQYSITIQASYITET